MDDDTERDSDRAEIMDCAREAEDAIRRLARITIHRSSLTPADIDVVLAQRAGAVAALPQAATQLGEMLDQAHDRFDLTMDTLTDSDDPAIAIGTARLHLDAACASAIEVYRHLDAAHNQTAHVSAIDRIGAETEHTAPGVRRPEHRGPPPDAGVNNTPVSHADLVKLRRRRSMLFVTTMTSPMRCCTQNDALPADAVKRGKSLGLVYEARSRRGCCGLTGRKPRHLVPT